MAKGGVTLETLFKELGCMKALQTGNHNEINSKLDGIKSNLDSATNVLNDHTNQLKSLDYEKRRKNLVIYGVSEEEINLEKLLLELFCRHMQIKDFTLMELDYCKRLGKQPNHANPRPILVGLTTQRRKIQIVKNSPLLKGTKVVVKPDFSTEDRENQKKLREERNTYRRQGKYAVIRSGKVVTSNENFVPTNDSNQNGKTPGKRALSKSPSNVPGTKKLNQQISMNLGLCDNSMMEDTETDHVQSGSQGSEPGMEFRTPILSPVRTHATRPNILQPSILNFMSPQSQAGQSNGKN